MEEFELEPGESITLQVRQHIFVLLFKLLPFIVLAVLPFIIQPLFALVPGVAHANGLSASFRFFVGLWWLFFWMGAFQAITKYFLSSWVITTHRIMDIYQFGFFRRKVSSFLLVRVQDVTTEVEGIFATLLGFGTINVETAGSHEEFRMRGIRNPEYIRDLIMREVAALHGNTSDLKSGL